MKTSQMGKSSGGGGGDVVTQRSCIEWRSMGQRLETRGKENQDLGGDQSKWTDNETQK